MRPLPQGDDRCFVLEYINAHGDVCAFHLHAANVCVAATQCYGLSGALARAPALLVRRLFALGGGRRWSMAPPSGDGCLRWLLSLATFSRSSERRPRSDAGPSTSGGANGDGNGDDEAGNGSGGGENAREGKMEGSEGSRGGTVAGRPTTWKADDRDGSSGWGGIGAAGSDGLEVVAGARNVPSSADEWRCDDKRWLLVRWLKAAW